MKLKKCTNKKWDLINEQLDQYKLILNKKEHSIISNLYEEFYFRAKAIIEKNTRNWFSYEETLSFIGRFTSALIGHHVQQLIEQNNKNEETNKIKNKITIEEWKLDNEYTKIYTKKNYRDNIDFHCYKCDAIVFNNIEKTQTIKISFLIDNLIFHKCKEKDINIKSKDWDWNRMEEYDDNNFED